MNDSVILKNLCLGYQSGHPVLVGVSTEFKEGGIYGLFGLNGSGKTTLFKGLSGLVQSQSGTIEVFGLKPFDRTKKFLQNLMFVPINPILPSITGNTFVRTYSSFWPGFSLNEFADTTNLLSMEEIQNLGSSMERLDKTA